VTESRSRQFIDEIEHVVQKIPLPVHFCLKTTFVSRPLLARSRWLLTSDLAQKAKYLCTVWVLIHTQALGLSLKCTLFFFLAPFQTRVNLVTRKLLFFGVVFGIFFGMGGGDEQSVWSGVLKESTTKAILITCQGVCEFDCRTPSLRRGHQEQTPLIHLRENRKTYVLCAQGESDDQRIK